MPDLHSINHVGMAVASMDAAAARYAALGFTLTPFSMHSGSWKPGEPVQRLGWGNRCAVFPNDYLEILASVDDAAVPERIAGYLARHQGAHIICFGTDDAAAVEARLACNGVATTGVIPLQRDVDTPQGVRTARFERLQFDPGATPEGYIQAARHLTPEFIHQPRYMAHPNGATAMTETILVTTEPDELERRYAAYCGGPAVRDGPRRTFRFRMGSSLSIVALADAPKVLPGSLLPAPPAIAGLAFRVASLDALRARLSAASIRHATIDGGQRLVVPAEEACGAALLFHS